MSVRNYAILWPESRRTATTASGGNQLLSTDQHALDGPEHTGQLPVDRLSTDELDTAKRLAPDGLGGVEWAATAGLAEAPVDHGNMGATETLDLTAGTWHQGTLDANCVITVSGFTVDESVVAVVKITQDGTGGWDITWDPDVIFSGDDQPTQTAGSVTWFLLWSDEGDATIYGIKVGVPYAEGLLTTETDTSLVLKPNGTGGVEFGVGSSVAALDDLTDVTITSAATGDKLRYNGSGWVNANLHDEPMIAPDGTVMTDGLLNPMMHEIAW